jgi:hypothetical protein
MCAACAVEQAEKKQRVSRVAETSGVSPASDGGGVPPIVHDVMRDGGQRLPADVRAFMEPRFGVDFSHVRLHTDDAAAQSCRAVSARAYTVGPHVAFDSGRFDTATRDGQRLLAHELTHVVQQRGATAAPETISHPDDASEHEADRTADRVLTSPTVGTPAPTIGQVGSSVQRLSGWGWAGIVVGGLAATGFTLWQLGVFDKEHFSTDELIQYLDGLATRRAPETHRDSDNKARDVVRHWEAGDAKINPDKGHQAKNASLTAVELKRLLILEMLDGVTAGDDERAIITILRRSTADEVQQLLDPSKGVSMQRLDDKINGDNHDELERVLEAKFPQGQRSALHAQEDKNAHCTARQALMVGYAQAQAVKWVDNAIVALNRLDDTAVKQALDCRFPGATLAQRAKILRVFMQAQQALPTRRYICAAEGAAAIEGTVVTLEGGLQKTMDCLAEHADSFLLKSGGALPQVALCDSFFSSDPDSQTTTLVHESVHAAGIAGDPHYQPGCGLDLETALQNPDSFAYLARDLMTLTGMPTAKDAASAGLPSVTVGNFRNTGPASPENRSELAQEIPGLGIDANTGLNIMEVRGDITGNVDKVQYDFRRTKENAIWRKVNGSWNRLRYVPPGTDDDSLNRDESLTPLNGHIYALDGPGLPELSAPLGPQTDDAEEAVYLASFLESVEARVPPAGWTRVSNELAWHSVTWLERPGGAGAWSRKAGKNEIELGALKIGQDPPEPAAAARPAAAPPPRPAPQPVPGGNP